MEVDVSLIPIHRRTTSVRVASLLHHRIRPPTLLHHQSEVWVVRSAYVLELGSHQPFLVVLLSLVVNIIVDVVVRVGVITYIIY